MSMSLRLPNSRHVAGNTSTVAMTSTPRGSVLCLWLDSEIGDFKGADSLSKGYFLIVGALTSDFKGLGSYYIGDDLDDLCVLLDCDYLCFLCDYFGLEFSYFISDDFYLYCWGSFLYEFGVDRYIRLRGVLSCSFRV